jgi:hypothetical protein
VSRWRQKANDGDERTSVPGEVSALREQKSLGINKESCQKENSRRLEQRMANVKMIKQRQKNR